MYRPVYKAEQRWLYALISWLAFAGAAIFLIGGSVKLSKALTGTPPHLREAATWDGLKTLGFGAAFALVGILVRLMLRNWDRWFPRVRKTERAAEFFARDVWGPFGGGGDRWLHRWVDWWARLWDRAEARSRKAQRRKKDDDRRSD